jgi:transposase
MVETRGQRGNTSVKTETLNNTTRSSGAGIIRRNQSRVAKKKASAKITNIHRPHHQVKIEDETDVKSLLKTPPKSPKPKSITQNQIKRFIGYIENDKMTLAKAARKAKISDPTGQYYYSVYQNDAKKNIPVPLKKSIAQIQHINEATQRLISYIVDDKMTLLTASIKAKVSLTTARRIYTSYLKSSNRSNRSLYHPRQENTNDRISKYAKRCTRNQIKRLIGYIVDDDMSIMAASIKADMTHATGKKYYQLYLNNPNHDIPMPCTANTREPCSQEKIQKLIHYFTIDRMSIKAAAEKAKISESSGRKYCKLHLKKLLCKTPGNIQGRINNAINYIMKDNLTIKAAAKKANISHLTASKYYKKYMEDNIQQEKTNHGNALPQEKVTTFIGYVVDDKMSIAAASKKANIGFGSGQKYYKNYVNQQKKATSIRKINLICNQDSEQHHESNDHSKKKPLVEETQRAHEEVRRENWQDNECQSTSQENSNNKSLTQLVQDLEKHMKNKDTSAPIKQETPVHSNNAFLSQLVDQLKQQLKDKDNTISLLNKANVEIRKSSDTTIDTFRLLVHSKEMEIEMLKKDKKVTDSDGEDYIIDYRKSQTPLVNPVDSKENAKSEQ